MCGKGAHEKDAEVNLKPGGKTIDEQNGSVAHRNADAPGDGEVAGRPHNIDVEGGVLSNRSARVDRGGEGFCSGASAIDCSWGTGRSAHLT